VPDLEANAGTIRLDLEAGSVGCGPDGQQQKREPEPETTGAAGGMMLLAHISFVALIGTLVSAV
jgi:hypothetical protein